MENKNESRSALKLGLIAGIVGVVAGIFGKQIYDCITETSQKEKAKQELMIKEEKKISTISDGTEWFICPISYDVMRDPVSTPEGITYERKSIVDWLKKNNYCPKTHKKLEIKDLKPNYALREAIEFMILKGGFIEQTKN